MSTLISANRQLVYLTGPSLITFIIAQFYANLATTSGKFNRQVAVLRGKSHFSFVVRRSMLAHLGHRGLHLPSSKALIMALIWAILGLLARFITYLW